MHTFTAVYVCFDSFKTNRMFLYINSFLKYTFMDLKYHWNKWAEHFQTTTSDIISSSYPENYRLFKLKMILKENFICNICNKFLNDPVYLPCHCYVCLLKNAVCPWHRTGPHWRHLFWRALKTSFPYFRYIWILSRHFSRLLFFNYARRL